MPFEIIINEASLPFSSTHECAGKLSVFFRVIHKTKSDKILINRADDDHGSWNSFVYAQDFQFGEWINRIVDKDLSRIVKSVVSDINCPGILLDSDLRDIFDGAMYVLSADQDVEVNSLGIASLAGAHAISFQTGENWECNPISIVRQWDEDGVWKEQDHSVPNITTVSEIEQYLERLVGVKQGNKTYLKTLKTENKEFPNIILFDNALKNLRSSSVTAQDCTRVIEVLNALSTTIIESSNLAELASTSGLSISEESKETMNNRKYARQRNFKSPGGGLVCCEAHVKNFLGGKRMHISVDYVCKNVKVGYFGHHLSTVKHPK